MLYHQRNLSDGPVVFFNQKNRTFVWFFGSVSDVENAIELYRELLLTIATAAHLWFRSYTRGSGASYAEGYVAGLPRFNDQNGTNSQSEETVSSHALIHARTIALHTAATKWLGEECDIHLSFTSGRQRDQHDPAAANLGKTHGKTHGATHQITPQGLPARIGHKG